MNTRRWPVPEAVPFHVDPRDDKRRVVLHLVPVQGAPRRRAFPWRVLALALLAAVLGAFAGWGLGVIP